LVDFCWGDFVNADCGRAVCTDDRRFANLGNLAFRVLQMMKLNTHRASKACGLKA
jgi:hypothetical protein